MICYFSFFSIDLYLRFLNPPGSSEYCRQGSVVNNNNNNNKFPKWAVILPGSLRKLSIRHVQNIP